MPVAEVGGEMTLFDHLRELRTRLVKCCLAIIVGGVVCYLAYDEIFRFVTGPYCEAYPTDQCRLVVIDVIGGFVLRMKVAGYGGIVVALPVIMWQLWRFVAPGLYKNERRYAYAFVASSTTLFAFGAYVAYISLVPMFEWLRGNIGIDVTQQFQTLDKYFSLVALMMIGFGFGFEFPLLLIALQLVGVLDNAVLRKHRRYAFVGIVALSAVITPGGDPISLFFLAFPMYLFYELSIIAGFVIKRRRGRRDAQTPPGDDESAPVPLDAA